MNALIERHINVQAQASTQQDNQPTAHIHKPTSQNHRYSQPDQGTHDHGQNESK